MYKRGHFSFTFKLQNVIWLWLGYVILKLNMFLKKHFLLKKKKKYSFPPDNFVDGTKNSLENPPLFLWLW